MTDKEIIERVNGALQEEFELETADMMPGARFREDLDMDSLDGVDMVIVLEQEFEFKIRKEEAIQGIVTLGDLHAFVINKKNAVVAGEE